MARDYSHRLDPSDICDHGDQEGKKSSWHDEGDSEAPELLIFPCSASFPCFLYPMCPKRSEPFCIVNHCIKLVTTSQTYSKNNRINR